MKTPKFFGLKVQAHEPSSAQAVAEALALRLTKASAELEAVTHDIEDFYRGVSYDRSKKTDMRTWIDAGTVDVRKGLMCLQRALYPGQYF